MSIPHETHGAHQHHVVPEAKEDALKRLNYIDGHLAGIRADGGAGQVLR